MGRPPKLSRGNDGDGSGEGGGSYNSGPLLSWSSGNRQHPWNLKRRASTNFVLPIPAIEESTYRLVLQQIQHRKRREYVKKQLQQVLDNNKASHVEMAQKIVKTAKQQVEISSAKVKHARDKLDHVKQLHEQAKTFLQRTMQRQDKEYSASMEQQIQTLKQQIESIKAPLQQDNNKSSSSVEKEEECRVPPVPTSKRHSDELEDGPKLKKLKLDVCNDDTTTTSSSKMDVGDVVSIHSGGAVEGKQGTKHDLASQDSHVATSRGEGEEGKTANEKHALGVETGFDAQKESLEKIKSDITDLNQTKSQLIWLLKQVITAENTRKEEAKRKAAIISGSSETTKPVS